MVKHRRRGVSFQQREVINDGSSHRVDVALDESGESRADGCTVMAELMVFCP